MTTYKTGNPIGSKDPRDLYDNAENLDVAVNDDAATWVDRLGVQRSTLWQMLEYSKQFNDRGDWQTSTAYARKDYFTYNGVTYVTLTAHTSTSVAADLAAGKIGVMSGNSGAMDFLQAGTGAVKRSVQSKLRDVVSITDFGAHAAEEIGFESYDNSAAIQAAVNYALASQGKTIYVPGGTYYCGSTITFTSNPDTGNNGSISVSLVGDGADNVQQAGSRLVYTAADSSPFISIAIYNSRFIKISGVDISSNNAAFSGKLVIGNVYNFEFTRCVLSAGINCTALLDLASSVDAVIQQVFFRGGKNNVISTSSNCIIFQQCDFGGQELYSADINGMSISFVNCAFEPASDTEMGFGIKANVTGLQISGGWFGDVVNYSAALSNWVNLQGAGHVISNNYFNGSGQHSVVPIEVTGNLDGLVITGNAFRASNCMVDIGTLLVKDLLMLGNQGFQVDAGVVGVIRAGTSIAQEQYYGTTQAGFVVDGDFRFPTGGQFLYGDGEDKTLFKLPHGGATLNKIFATIAHVYNKTTVAFKSRFYASLNNYADSFYWVFTNQYGAGVEKETLQIIGGTIRPGFDNGVSLGGPANRFTTIYAATGTINTSDANEKQQIRQIGDAEKRAATKIKGLIKAFKFNQSVAEKGDLARTHFGVIAQDIKQVFDAEGLNADDYGLFCKDEYTVDGETKTRLGIRYDELLTFVIATL